MIVVDVLKKPYTDEEKKQFIVKNNHCLGFRILETDKELQALDYSEEEKKEQNKEFEIQDLKKQLDETDYKIIKCSEYSLAGKELPYDIEYLHTQRQAIRDRITELEG